MVPTLTRRNAEVSFKAIALGTLDYVPKPDSNREITTSLDFRREVIRKIKLLGHARTHQVRREGAPQGAEDETGIKPPTFRKRPFSLVPPRVVAVGSSTGGPDALASVLGVASPSLSRVPVVIAQHMPPVFTGILAERLTRATGRDAKEGAEGEALLPGKIYVAPGNHHMTVVGRGQPALRIRNEPPVHFCRPAALPAQGSAGCCPSGPCVNSAIDGPRWQNKASAAGRSAGRIEQSEK